MADTDHTTFFDDPDTDHDTHHDDTHDSDSQHGDAQHETATQSQSQSQDAGGSTAAERLGGPSESATATESRSDGSAESGGEPKANLIPADRAESYRGRWNELKGEFVDEPRTAVRGANELVGEVLDELEQLFRRQRDELESGLNSDDTTTEDLRQALGNYRSFFDRLLSF